MQCTFNMTIVVDYWLPMIITCKESAVEANSFFTLVGIQIEVNTLKQCRGLHLWGPEALMQRVNEIQSRRSGWRETCLNDECGAFIHLNGTQSTAQSCLLSPARLKD